MVEIMLEARDYYLPLEIIYDSIDHRIYDLSERMSKQFSSLMEPIQRRLLDIENLVLRDGWTNHDENDEAVHVQLNDLRSKYEEMRRRHASFKIIAEQKRRENHIIRAVTLLGCLNDPVDQQLGLGPTERLQEVLQLAKEGYFNESSIILNSLHGSTEAYRTTAMVASLSEGVVDLRDTDLSQVDFERVDFTGTRTKLSPRQEADFLTPSNRMQRYRLMYDYARTGNIEDFDRLISQCSLDINCCDDRGSTALMHTCVLKHFDMMRHMMQKYNARIDIKTPKGWDIVSVLCSNVRNHSTEDASVYRNMIDYFVQHHSVELTLHNIVRLADSHRLEQYLRGVQSEVNTRYVTIAERRDAFHTILTSRCLASRDTVADIAAVNNDVASLTILHEFLFPWGLETGGRYPHPLWTACNKGSEGAALFIARLAPQLLAIPYGSTTPLKTAVKSGHIALAKLLRETFRNETNHQMEIEFAVAFHDQDWLEHYFTQQQVQAGAMANRTSRQLHELSLALLFAAKYGWIDYMEDMVIRYHIDLNYRFQSQYTGKRVVDVLIEEFNDESGEGDPIRLSLSWLFGTSLPQNTFHDRALHLNESHPTSPPLIIAAIQYRKLSLVNMILRYNPDLSNNILDSMGRTSLICFLSTIESMMEDLSRPIEDNNMEGEVDSAAVRLQQLCTDTLNAMFRLNADLMVRNPLDGSTPMHYGAAIGQSVVALIQSGIISARNRSGITPQDISRITGTNIIW